MRLLTRSELISTLTDYNEQIGNTQEAFQQIARLEQDNVKTVVTGQQLGLFGGPAYAVLKGISVLIEAKKKGFVPVFWLATEDHDIDEIDHTYLIDPVGNLKKHQMHFPRNGKSVESLVLSSQDIEVFRTFFSSIGVEKFASLPSFSSSYPHVMARVMVELFKGTGMVFVEPKIFRPWLTPWITWEIENQETIFDVLTKAKKQLLAKGRKAPIQLLDAPQLFFFDEVGRRHRLLIRNGRYRFGKESLSKQALLRCAISQPERFSTAVTSRPLVQNLLFQPATYIAGPTEALYLAQLAPYSALLEEQPCQILPRMEVTFISPTLARWLEQTGLDPKQPIPIHWEEVLPRIGVGLPELQAGITKEMQAYVGDVFSLGKIKSLTAYWLKTVRHKTVKARLADYALPPFALHCLQNSINPMGKPQERVLNWWQFEKESSVPLVPHMLTHFSDHPSLPQLFFLP